MGRGRRAPDCGIALIVITVQSELSESSRCAAACPKRGENNTVPESQWVGGKGTKNPMQVKRFVCASCGTGYVSWTDRTGKTKTMTKKPHSSGAL